VSGSELNVPTEEVLSQLPLDGGPDWNRLVFESSPYLLQHAANPVDWYPFGDHAFAVAKESGKPIFVSIGYATCHWCHVMERESFEDEEAAALLNETFVCIKVDKEERPDLDDIYMTACQAMTGQGGWPLTVMLTHERKPFFAGTYFPKHSQYGRIGLMDLVQRVGAAWRERPLDLARDAERITEQVRSLSGTSPAGAMGESVLSDAFSRLVQTFDRKNGGFGSRPKFPTPHHYNFLLRYWKRSGDERALAVVEHSLKSMRKGGIFDHVGFGFHRYATDEVWLLPHFEKMLYDQAMLAMAYLETYQATKNTFYAWVAREIFTYVMRDMTDAEGGFYCAEDADSEGVEGKFYVWTPAQINEVLGKKDGALYCKVYEIHKKGNFSDEASGKASGENIPHLTRDLAAWAARLKAQPEELATRLEDMRARLFAHREQRIHPLKDDKVLTDWNGLMIAAFAMGGRILNDVTYTQVAVRAAAFTHDRLRDGNGYLVKRFRAGKAGLPAHLDDYAFQIWGLLEIHQTTLDSKWLQRAISLLETAETLFYNADSGAWFFANPEEQLILRGEKIYDGAIPSGNSVMALNLARLFRLTGRTVFRKRAEDIATAFSGQVSEQPTMSTLLMCCLDLLLGAGCEVVIAGDPQWATTQELLSVLRTRFMPGAQLLLKSPNDDLLGTLAPYTRDQVPGNGVPMAYVCRDHSCSEPTSDPVRLANLLP